MRISRSIETLIFFLVRMSFSHDTIAKIGPDAVTPVDIICFFFDISNKFSCRIRSLLIALALSEIIILQSDG